MWFRKKLKGELVRVKYKFEPKQDMTINELTRILECCNVLHMSYTNWWRLSPEEKRHFRQEITDE